MSQSHTKGPWEVYGATSIVKFGEDHAEIAVVLGPASGNRFAGTGKPLDLGDPRWDEGCANAKLISQAPDLLDQFLALYKYGWELERKSCYDEEGVEGWAWVEPDGTDHVELGSWDELPPWPESARIVIARLEGRE